LGARSFNVGIDKNHAVAADSWPQDVVDANLAYGKKEFSDAVCTVLSGDADAVVLPYMSTRNGVLTFGNDPAVEAQRPAYARRIADDPRFDADVGEWLTVLRARSGGPCAPSSS